MAIVPTSMNHQTHTALPDDQINQIQDSNFPITNQIQQKIVQNQTEKLQKPGILQKVKMEIQKKKATNAKNLTQLEKVPATQPSSYNVIANDSISKPAIETMNSHDQKLKIPKNHTSDKRKIQHTQSEKEKKKRAYPYSKKDDISAVPTMPKLIVPKLIKISKNFHEGQKQTADIFKCTHCNITTYNFNQCRNCCKS